MSRHSEHPGVLCRALKTIATPSPLGDIKIKASSSPLIASTSAPIRDECLSFLRIFPFGFKLQARSIDELFWDFRTRFGNDAFDSVFLAACGQSFLDWMGLINEWWLESALLQYQNKWGRQLGKEYIQRTGGWEHLWLAVATEMGETQIGAGKKQSIPGVSYQKAGLVLFRTFLLTLNPDL